MRRVLVVAHPDDEVLWFGGLLLTDPGDWTVICCSIPRTDPIRAYKYFDACDRLSVKGKLLPFVEENELRGLDSLDLREFDQIVTHGSAGEYGHKHHVQLHQHVLRHWRGRVLTGCYGVPGETDYEVRLTPSQYARKMDALKAYDHVSASDASPKWLALLDRYGNKFDLRVERYALA